MDNKTSGKSTHRKKCEEDALLSEDAKMEKRWFPLLCFDSETTNRGELLELSVFDGESNEIFHEYFKPRAKSWPTDIHHISPAQVAGCKNFTAYRKDVRRLLNSASYFVGCALSNDLHTLRRYGIRVKNSVRVFDIQNLFWLLNDTSERLEKQQKGLSAIADHYGLSFGEEQPHSATADTRMTLACFKAMVNDFYDKFPAYRPDEICENLSVQALQKFSKRFDAEYQRALQVFRMQNSKGFINVVRREQGYSFKYTRFEQTVNDDIVLSLPVTDRVKAEADLREHFFPIQVKGFTGIYNLGDSDFEYIRHYRNTIDLDTFIEREKIIKAEKDLARERTLKASKAVKSARPSEKNKGNKKANEPGSDSSGNTGKAKSSKKSRNSHSKPSLLRAGTRAMRSAKKKSRFIDD